MQDHTKGHEESTTTHICVMYGRTYGIVLDSTIITHLATGLI